MFNIKLTESPKENHKMISLQSLRLNSYDKMIIEKAFGLKRDREKKKTTKLKIKIK